MILVTLLQIALKISLSHFIDEQEGRKDIYGDTGYLAAGEVCEE